MLTLPEPVGDEGDGDKRREDDVGLVAAGEHATEAFDAAEQAFDLAAALFDLGVVLPGVCADAEPRNDTFETQPRQHAGLIALASAVNEERDPRLSMPRWLHRANPNSPAPVQLQPHDLDNENSHPLHIGYVEDLLMSDNMRGADRKGSQ